MSIKAFRLIALLVLCLLLLAGCQPIQPVQPAPQSAAMPELVERVFPVPGITVSLPEGNWFYIWEPNWPAVNVFSEAPPPDPQSTHGHWEYLMEEPIVEITLFNWDSYGAMADELGDSLAHWFASASASYGMINPKGQTTVVEEPTLFEINGQPAAKMVVTGEDVVLDKPFNAHVWAILGDGRIVYVSCALLPQNEAQFLPIVEKIVQTVVVNKRQAEPPRTVEVTGEIAPGETITATNRASPSDKVVRDFWHFAGTAKTFYRITVKPLDQYSDIVGDVVDARGFSQVAMEQDNGSNNAAEVFGFVAKEDGDYYIAVRHFFLDAAPYTVTLERLD